MNNQKKKKKKKKRNASGSSSHNTAQTKQANCTTPSHTYWLTLLHQCTQREKVKQKVAREQAQIKKKANQLQMREKTIQIHKCIVLKRKKK